MAAIVIKHGYISLAVEQDSHILSAEEIFGVVFEGVNSLHGMPISRDDFLLTGLKFCQYSADPTIVLQPKLHDGLPIVECRFFAKSSGSEAEVARHNDGFLDYVLINTMWIPLPQGSLEAAKSFLKLANLRDFGPISLKHYLRILQLHDIPLALDDRTQGIFGASQISNKLRGDIPIGFVGDLYSYQLTGYQWLAYMRDNDIGGIIADEMGLGKTIQVICLLLGSKEIGRSYSLVIAPATLLENWRREIRRFAPSLQVCVHKGLGRTGFPEDLRQYDVVLTSYDTAVVDVALLKNITWDLVVIDEAQAIKNPKAKRTIRLKTLPRRCSIAMTGTPVENRLTDLWSITDFIVPSLLGTLPLFERKHPDTIPGADTLEPIVTPIILRRKITEVANDLPERIDIPQPLELDSESAEVYEALRLEESGRAASNLGALTKLRMFCTHPWLVNQFTQVTSPADCSAKYQRLIEIMEEIVAAYGKVLIFTSYQQSADLLFRELALCFNIHTDIIDGRTPIGERQPKVDFFTNYRSAAALILNPRAAGTGLNISAANHVIHFNLEWNPAVEDQASARAYRRGQKQSVTVHRFYYIDTVEAVINERMERKRQLAQTAIIGTDGSYADVQDILRAMQASPINRIRRETQ